MRLLIIEDDETVARFLQRGLKNSLYSADIALTGEEGLRLLSKNEYDMIILDYYLPDMNGAEVVKKIKDKKPNIGVIALSNESKTEIKVSMLSDCDDYVVKPFSTEELVARIRAVSKRGVKVRDQVLSCNGLEMCTKSHEVKCDGKFVPLSNKEFTLLQYLMENSNRVVTRNMILEKIWDINADPFTNTVDVHIQRIRSKIGSRGKELIVTISGVGYKFVDRTRDKAL